MQTDIAVGPFEEGEVISVESLPNLGFRTAERFATVRVAKREVSIARIPEHLRSIDTLAPFDAPANRVVRLSERLKARSRVAGLEFRGSETGQSERDTVGVADRPPSFEGALVRLEG